MIPKNSNETRIIRRIELQIPSIKERFLLVLSNLLSRKATKTRFEKLSGFNFNELTKVIIGSSASISFGIWHFFVPKLWKWYSYIDINVTELILAVRAINIFFSLSLVLFGILNILFIYSSKSNRYSIIVLRTAICIFWITRLVFQLIYPQGSINPLIM